MSELIPLLTADEIHLLVKDIAQRISADYRGREPVLVAVLKGSFIFLADLIRQLSIPVKIDFLRAASYGGRMQSSGAIRLSEGISLDIQDRDVLLIEDIVDSGLTLSTILTHLRTFKPRSLGVCALIDKRERRQADVPIAYAGRVTGQGFLVGYGLDYAEDYRYLPGIYRLQL